MTLWFFDIGSLKLRLIISILLADYKVVPDLEHEQNYNWMKWAHLKNDSIQWLWKGLNERVLAIWQWSFSFWYGNDWMICRDKKCGKMLSIIIITSNIRQFVQQLIASNHSHSSFFVCGLSCLSFHFIILPSAKFIFHSNTFTVWNIHSNNNNQICINKERHCESCFKNRNWAIYQYWNRKWKEISVENRKRAKRSRAYTSTKKTATKQWAPKCQQQQQQWGTVEQNPINRRGNFCFTSTLWSISLNCVHIFHYKFTVLKP